MLKKLRRFIVRLLQDPDDDGNDDLLVPVPHEHDATLNEIRDNHLFHQALALNKLHLRLGGVEARVDLILAGIGAVITIVAAPYIERLGTQVITHLF